MARDSEVLQWQQFCHHGDTICHPKSGYVTTKLRASKSKDHEIGRSPYFYETKSGDFLRELFKAFHKIIGLYAMTCVR